MGLVGGSWEEEALTVGGLEVGEGRGVKGLVGGEELVARGSLVVAKEAVRGWLRGWGGGGLRGWRGGGLRRR